MAYRSPKLVWDQLPIVARVVLLSVVALSVWVGLLLFGVLFIVNLSYSQLNMMLGSFIWEAPSFGVVLLAAYALATSRPFVYLKNPAHVYRYTLWFPTMFAGGLVGLAILGAGAGALVMHLAAASLVETVKLCTLGVISSLLIGVFGLLSSEVLMRSIRRQLERHYRIAPTTRIVYARRMFAVGVAITIVGLLFIGLAVLESYQRITVDTHQLVSVMTRYAIAAAVVLVLALVMIGYFGSTLTATLRSLSLAVRKSRDSLEPFTFSTYTADELEELALAFRYYINQSNELRAHLEEKVKQRTAALLTAEEGKRDVEVASAQQQTGFEHQKRQLAESVTKQLEEKVRERTAALRDAIRHLQELDRVKSEFISLASHQLRTPLTSLRWAQHALLEGSAGKLTVDQKQIIETTLDRTLYMMNLVNELLDVTRIEDQQYELKRAATLLHDLLAKVAFDFADAATHKQITFAVRLPKQLPTLTIDSDKIAMAVSNIVDNAIKYTPAGGKVTFTASHDAGTVHLKVTDTGVGIPPEDLYRTFTKFFRASNAVAMHTAGSGLGLFIAKTIVEKHGGTVEITSEVGQGTTVTVTLPVRLSGAASPASADSSPKLGAIRSLINPDEAEGTVY